jgi:hypothetical protein
MSPHREPWRGLWLSDGGVGAPMQLVTNAGREGALATLDLPLHLAYAAAGTLLRLAREGGGAFAAFGWRAPGHDGSRALSVDLTARHAAYLARDLAAAIAARLPGGLGEDPL